MGGIRDGYREKVAFRAVEQELGAGIVPFHETPSWYEIYPVGHARTVVVVFEFQTRVLVVTMVPAAFVGGNVTPGGRLKIVVVRVVFRRVFSMTRTVAASMLAVTL